MSQISEPAMKKRRLKGSGSEQDERKKLKTAGKEYITRKKIQVPAKQPPSLDVTCKCKYKCKEIDSSVKQDLFIKYYSEDRKIQGTYIMGLINITEVGRRRKRNTNSEENRRQATMTYCVPDGKGVMIQICKATFMNIFALSRKEIETLVRKKKEGKTTFVDERTCHKQEKFTDCDRQRVRGHITSLPRDVSHYSRKRSSKEYLSQDLNMNLLVSAFNEKHPNDKVSYKYYRKCFYEDCPNLKFRRPRSDTCKMCDKLQNKIRLLRSPGNKTLKFDLELHQRKAEKAYTEMKSNAFESQQPGSAASCAAFDLQQVLSVPTLTHSEMFYKRQLSCFNFGFSVCDTGTSYMCMWHEGIAGRGGNEIASCLLKIINMDFIHKRKMSFWSDNCIGQNKNRMIIFLFLFLVANNVFDQIDHKFLVSGHSFMQCDRDFALIEKRKRRMKSYIPRDLHKVVKSAKTTNPFRVLEMEECDFFNFQESADKFINTKKLNITSAVWIRVEAKSPGTVLIRQVFNEAGEWKRISVLKKGVTMDDLRRSELHLCGISNRVTLEKKHDLVSMLEYLPEEEHRAFYRNLCSDLQ